MSTAIGFFHNHMTIEPLLGLWHFSDPQFRRISSGIRRAVVREAVADGTFDLIFSSSGRSTTRTTPPS